MNRRKARVRRGAQRLSAAANPAAESRDVRAKSAVVVRFAGGETPGLDDFALVDGTALTAARTGPRAVLAIHGTEHQGASIDATVRAMTVVAAKGIGDTVGPVRIDRVAHLAGGADVPRAAGVGRFRASNAREPGRGRGVGSSSRAPQPTRGGVRLPLGARRDWLLGTSGRNAWRSGRSSWWVGRASIPVKVSAVLGAHNRSEIDGFLRRCSDLGVQRAVVRRLFGEPERWPVLANEVPVRSFRGSPVYDLSGREVTIWDFDGARLRSLNLFADGTLGTSYLLTETPELGLGRGSPRAPRDGKPSRRWGRGNAGDA